MASHTLYFGVLFRSYTHTSVNRGGSRRGRVHTSLCSITHGKPVFMYPCTYTYPMCKHTHTITVYVYKCAYVYKHTHIYSTCLEMFIFMVAHYSQCNMDIKRSDIHHTGLMLPSIYYIIVYTAYSGCVSSSVL